MLTVNQQQIHLTKSELAIMQALWGSERPLCGSEIMSIIDNRPEGPVFSKSSYHVLINDLLAKNYIVPVSGRGHGKHQARAFSPTVTHTEYHAMQISASELFNPCDIPDLLDSLIKNCDDIDLDSLKDKVSSVIDSNMSTSESE